MLLLRRCIKMLHQQRSKSAISHHNSDPSYYELPNCGEQRCSIHKRVTPSPDASWLEEKHRDETNTYFAMYLIDAANIHGIARIGSHEISLFRNHGVLE